MFSMEQNQIYEQISWFMPSFIGSDRPLKADLKKKLPMLHERIGV